MEASNMNSSVLEEVDPSVLDDIYMNFFDKEEYGDFEIAARNFRQVDPDSFLIENENNNTKRKTESDMRLFNSFLMSKNVTLLPELMPPEQLNELMCQFILAVTKKDGREYEPSSIKGFVGSIDRHLRNKNSNISIYKDKQFQKCRAVLIKKQQQLKQQGLGNKPQTAVAIDNDTLEKMYQANTLGDKNPRSLIHSLWLICTTFFGMRTGKECHDLCWGDIQIGIDEGSGHEYLQYDKERQTKTRSGANPRDTRLVKPKAYFNPDNQQKDPVHLFKMYKEKRPADLCQDEDPFFLTPGSKVQKCWYRRCPMGINKLYNIMNEMKEDAGIQNKRITPYSARKRLIQTLQDEDVPANQIVQVSGHKNINSLNNYSHINNKQCREISNIISGRKNSPVETARSATSSSSNVLGEHQVGGLGAPSGLFSGTNFNGPVTFNFNSQKMETQTMSQTLIESEIPSGFHRQFKRIRRPLSDSESD